jgi:hypothetical protein
MMQNTGCYKNQRSPYLTRPPTLVADIKLNSTNSRSALMIVTLNSGYGVGTEDTHAMFKVLPLILCAFTMNDFAI